MQNRGGLGPRLLGRIATFPLPQVSAACSGAEEARPGNEAIAGCTHSQHGYKTTLSLGFRFQNSRYGNGIVSCL